MRHHTVQQFTAGPRTGKWVYTGGPADGPRPIECCAEAGLEVMAAPRATRTSSPAWQRIGHDTSEEAYAHMRAVLLERLRLDVSYRDWSGCRAPAAGGICDTPTKSGADLPSCHFTAPLCDDHRNRRTVEAMWDGPGDWSGSW